MFFRTSGRILAITALVSSLPALGATAGQEKLPFEDEINAFEAQDKIKMPKKGGILFIGSSSIRLWKTLEKDFPGQPVINRGFGGSQISDSIRYIPRIVTPYKPKMIVFFAGTNDIASKKTAEKVADDFCTFVQTVRAELPQVKVAFLSITPAPSRWSMLDEVKKANQLVRNYCFSTEGLTYIDAFPYMLDAEGGPRPELFVSDQLHMNDKGYEIWRKLVRPIMPWKL